MINNNNSNSNSTILLGYLIYIDPHRFESHEYEKLQRSVLSLGGKLSPSIRKDLTCAIFHSVNCENYLLTMRRFSGMMITSAKWLIDCYRRRELLPLEQYRLLCFTGLIISCTGIDQSQRFKIRNLIQENGGRFSEQLEKDKTTHLICESPQGAKYEAAVNWEIPIVKQSWINDCIRQKQYLGCDKHKLKATKGNIKSEETNYQLENEENIHSNLSRKRNYDSKYEELHSARKIAKSSGPTDSVDQNQVEKSFSQSTIFSNKSLDKVVFDDIKPLDLPPLSNLPNQHSNIFEGFRFFVHGFLPEMEAYLVAAIITCGGEVSHTIHSGVQFFVAGTKLAAPLKVKVKEIIHSNLHVVDGQWLLQCIFHNPPRKE